ncbi:MAG: hypothetical protein K0V04_20610 [Deltaproteobacteria bacterium]|nr:hypothetical protein [Deltaproteobacteria bacterium]
MRTPIPPSPSPSPLLCAVGLALSLGTCDSSSEPDPTASVLLEEQGELPSADTPDSVITPIAEVELPGGGILTFLNPDEDSIVVALDSPKEADGSFAYLMETYDPTPLELFIHYAAADAQPPELLWVNHRAEVEAQGLVDSAPRDLLLPRTTFPAYGLETYYCTNNVWQNDWEDSFDHRDVVVSAFKSSQWMSTSKLFYSGSGDVQRVHWGVCAKRIIEQPNDYIAGVRFRMFKRNGTFNWGCGGAGWSATTNWNGVSENKVHIRYYYAGATADKTCISITKELIGVGEHNVRSFGVGAAYDYPSGVGL